MPRGRIIRFWAASQGQAYDTYACLSVVISRNTAGPEVTTGLTRCLAVRVADNLSSDSDQRGACTGRPRGAAGELVSPGLAFVTLGAKTRIPSADTWQIDCTNAIIGIQFVSMAKSNISGIYLIVLT